MLPLKHGMVTSKYVSAFYRGNRCDGILIVIGNHRRYLDQQPFPESLSPAVNPKHRRHLHQQFLSWQSCWLYSDCLSGRLARQEEDSLDRSSDLRYRWHLTGRCIFFSYADARSSGQWTGQWYRSLAITKSTPHADNHQA